MRHEGVSGNLAGFWSGLARREDATSWKAIDEEMKIFLAGMGGRWWILDEPVEKKKNRKA